MSSSSNNRIVIAGSGRAALACGAILAPHGYRVEVLASEAGVYDAFEAFDASVVPLLRSLGVDDATWQRHVERVQGFNGSETFVGRRETLRRVLFHHAILAGAKVTYGAKTLRDSDWRIDATGRTARYTRVTRATPAVAYFFESGAVNCLEMKRLEAMWSYRIGNSQGSTVAIIAPADKLDSAELRSTIQSIGVFPASGLVRRAATAQRANEPIVERRIAIGDAALAQDPVLGQGQRFALVSGALAAATIRTIVERPRFENAARQFYSQAVHRAGRGTAQAVPRAELGKQFAFTGAVASGAVLHDGMIVEERVIAWQGDEARWIAGVDVVAELEAFRAAGVGWHVVDRLVRRGVTADLAYAAVISAVRRGLLAPR